MENKCGQNQRLLMGAQDFGACIVRWGTCRINSGPWHHQSKRFLASSAHLQTDAGANLSSEAQYPFPSNSSGNGQNNYLFTLWLPEHFYLHSTTFTSSPVLIDKMQNEFGLLTLKEANIPTMNHNSIAFWFWRGKPIASQNI